MTKQPTEDDLLRLANVLGEAISRCTEEEQGHIKRLYADVQKFDEEQKAKGVHIDRAAFFAAGIILHEHIENEAARKAAIDYVEMDHLFVKSQEELRGDVAPPTQAGEAAAAEAQTSENTGSDTGAADATAKAATEASS